MKFLTKTTTTLDIRTDLLVVPVTSDGTLPASLPATATALVQAVLARGDLKFKAGNNLLLAAVPDAKVERLLLVAVPDGAVSRDDFRSMVNAATSTILSSSAASVHWLADTVSVADADLAWQAQIIATAAAQQSYRYTEMKSKPPEGAIKLSSIALLAGSAADRRALGAGAGVGTAIGGGINLARDLGNTPANYLTPRHLASRARQMARGNSKLSASVLDEKQMQALGMGSLLSVSAGSEEPARLIVLQYKGGPKSQAPVALVGKGITFDTGGISLKGGAAMDEMKFDMCGAASVLGATYAAAQMELKLNLVTIVAAAENMPDGKATKPGDVVTSMSGQTIEILNTDAEGRLVLADALTYAERYKPRYVVDVATLTGAIVVSLGSATNGLFSNNDELAAQLSQAGEAADDRAWRLPIWDVYQKQLRSNFADMQNIGGREAGSITAACFLSRFAGAYPWAHLDVAGTAHRGGAAKGATGRPVPLLTQWLMSLV